MFLILHKVRDLPALDIAEKMQCPECSEGCDECDNYGYWWICSTSGHRAHPYKWWAMDEELDLSQAISDLSRPAPEGWPDHFKMNKAPKASALDLLASLTAHLPAKPMIKRRI